MRKLLLSAICFLFISVSYGQEISIDKRAYSYYSKEQISKMPAEKIKQINFLYQESFFIPSEFKEQIDSESIDVRMYSKKRLPDERAKVYLLTDGKLPENDNVSDVYIYLLSINELREGYNNIK